MNEHFYELVQLSQSKRRQYEREAAQYSQIPKGRLRRRLAGSLRTLAERLEPATTPVPVLERGV